ncbi:hypothetical protein [Arthrobacter zhaoguopingii]|uniref:hypothetical protein n=1 Tax=Arthrobacter zhaoguopingii TaxID=2681491 RepID=UPI00135681C5|nr:hypothetical protein [Arthrobacter zhaoguopingii]
MNPDIDLGEVHALSVRGADSPLRERQILMLQQSLYNARVRTLPELARVIEVCTGRPITSLREIRQSELRPMLRHVQTMMDKVDVDPQSIPASVPARDRTFEAPTPG